MKYASRPRPTEAPPGGRSPGALRISADARPQANSAMSSSSAALPGQSDS